MLKRWFAMFWTRRVCAEDTDPDYRYHARMGEFTFAVQLREIMTDFAKARDYQGNACPDAREK